MRLEEIGPDEWSRALPESGYEVFHLPEALRVLDRHTDSTLRLYGVFKGQEAVGLFPAFVDRKAGGTIVNSPPNGMAVPRLGPIVMPTSPKQRKRETVNSEVTELVLDEIDADAGRSLVRLACPIDYDDPRPFQWADMDVRQSFTYLLDLESTTAQAVRDGFSRDLRTEIRELREAPITVEVEDARAAGNVYADVARRYDEHHEMSPASREYVRDLVEALGDRSRVYVVRDETGEYLGGAIVLYSDDVAMFWHGGVRADRESAGVDSRLHWEIISDVLEDRPHGVSAYDLVGANAPQLCRYPTRFGADLAPYYTVESSGAELSLAKRAYSFVTSK